MAIIFLSSSLSTYYLLFFNIMDSLKLSVNIGLITYTLNTCSFRWRPVPGVYYFFYMETLEMEDMGEIHQTLLCHGPVELTSGRKRDKRHLSLFNDILVVSNNLWICATFLTMKGYTLIRPFCIKNKIWLCTLLGTLEAFLFLSIFLTVV